jgi:hypothetical protein
MKVARVNETFKENGKLTTRKILSPALHSQSIPMENVECWMAKCKKWKVKLSPTLRRILER